MRCVFGIDVSKATINLVIAVNQVFVKETKLPMTYSGFQELKSLLVSFNSFRSYWCLFSASSTLSNKATCKVCTIKSTES